VDLDESGNEIELGQGAFGVVVKETYRMAPVAIKRALNQLPDQQEAFRKDGHPARLPRLQIHCAICVC
jgi:hypothetical protein